MLEGIQYLDKSQYETAFSLLVGSLCNNERNSCDGEGRGLFDGGQYDAETKERL